MRYHDDTNRGQPVVYRAEISREQVKMHIDAKEEEVVVFLDPQNDDVIVEGMRGTTWHNYGGASPRILQSWRTAEMRHEKRLRQPT